MTLRESVADAAPLKGAWTRMVVPLSTGMVVAFQWEIHGRSRSAQTVNDSYQGPTVGSSSGTFQPASPWLITIARGKREIITKTM